MTFTEAVKTCFTKYADFKGRASRSEFWWWALFVLLGGIVISSISFSLSAAFYVGTLLPYVAVGCRRLHDTGRSGWYQLLGLIPVIGWILLLVWLAQDSNVTSRYAGA